MYEQFGLMAGAFAAALALLMMRHQPGDGAAPAGPPEPGDEGPKPQPPIPPDELVILKGAVVDAETGRPAPCRVHIEDAEGRYCAPEGHQFISGEKIYTTGVDDEPDIVNRSHIWAMLPDGNFTVRLRAADGYSVQLEHGLEYDRAVETVDLANDAGKAIERTFQMARGIDMRAAGWMAADTHVHNLTPGETARQMPIEGID